MIAYINTQNSKIVREGRHLLVKKGNDIYHTLFTYKLTQVMIFGNVEITHPALCMLLKNNIDTVFFTRNGRYLGRLAPVESKNVFLRKRQYRLLDDPDFGLKISKNIVSGKLANMATIMMRIKRSRGSSEAGKKAKQIQSLLDGLNDIDSIEGVRGYEGRGTAIYFSGFRFGFTDNTTFTRRVRRPPTDPVNSVLSLLYTFLMNRVYAAVRATGLDPYPAFLHSIDYGRYSLVLDLMEEFRPIIADALTFSLFNLKILKQTDFRTVRPAAAGTLAPESIDDMPDVTADTMGMMTTDDCADETFDLPEQRIDEPAATSAQTTGKYPVQLIPDAFKRVIVAFEKKLTSSFYYPPEKRNITYADAMMFQALHYRKVIEGEADVYQPLLLK